MQPLEHKAPSLPLPNLEDENIPRTGRETMSQVQVPVQNPAATNLYATKPAETSPTKHKPQSQEIPMTQNECYRQNKKNHDSQKKVQGEGTHPAYTFHPTSTAPAPTVVTVSTQTPMVRSTAESIPVTIHKLATGQFAEVPHPTHRSLNDSPPPLEDIPSAPVILVTPWPNAGLASENLFETRKDWPIPLLQSPHPNSTIKTEEQPKIAAIPHTMTMPKQATEKCSWGSHCPICKNEEEHGEEGWDGDLQNQPSLHPQTFQQPQPQPQS